jgi:MIP family channel proteins
LHLEAVLLYLLLGCRKNSIAAPQWANVLPADITQFKKSEITMKDLNKLMAEGLGTFYLCFAGIGSILYVSMNNAEGPSGLLLIALAHGLALSIGVAVTGGISGGHLNPAVTAGMWITKRIESALAVKYVIAQLIGAAVAAYIVINIYPGKVVDDNETVGIPLPGSDISVATLLLAEFVMTFLLVTAVFSVAVDTRGKAVKIGAFVIGLTVAIDIMAGGAITGASMNPARSFGPAWVHMHFSLHLYYWIAPLLGGMAAGLFYHHCLLGKETDDAGGEE